MNHSCEQQEKFDKLLEFRAATLTGIDNIEKQLETLFRKNDEVLKAITDLRVNEGITKTKMAVFGTFFASLGAFIGNEISKWFKV